MKVKDQAAEQQQELVKTLESRATSAEAELIALRAISKSWLSELTRINHQMDSKFLFPFSLFSADLHPVPPYALFQRQPFCLLQRTLSTPRTRLSAKFKQLGQRGLRQKPSAKAGISRTTLLPLMLGSGRSGPLEPSWLMLPSRSTVPSGPRLRLPLASTSSPRS